MIKPWRRTDLDRSQSIQKYDMMDRPIIPRRTLPSDWMAVYCLVIVLLLVVFLIIGESRLIHGL